MRDVRGGDAHLGELLATAEDAAAKSSERRDAVKAIARLEGDQAAGSVVDLAPSIWMGDRAQIRVVDVLAGRGARTTLVRLLGQRHMGDRARRKGLDHLASLGSEEQLTAMRPLLADPGDCDPAALLELMRVLAASDAEGARAVTELADAPDAAEVVRTEARTAIEHERPDLAPGGDHVSPAQARKQVLTFSANRLSARWCVRVLHAYAERNRIPLAVVGVSGLFIREIVVAVTARPATIADLNEYVESLRRMSIESPPHDYGATTIDDGIDWVADVFGIPLP